MHQCMHQCVSMLIIITMQYVKIVTEAMEKNNIQNQRKLKMAISAVSRYSLSQKVTEHYVILVMLCWFIE